MCNKYNLKEIILGLFRRMCGTCWKSSKSLLLVTLFNEICFPLLCLLLSRVYFSVFPSHFRLHMYWLTSLQFSSNRHQFLALNILSLSHMLWYNILNALCERYMCVCTCSSVYMCVHRCVWMQKWFDLIHLVD